MTDMNGASACGLVSMRAFARGVNSVILWSANLYPYVAHHGKSWNIYGSARNAIVLNVVNHFNYSSEVSF